ncbi:MAG: hypothetical protein E5W82_18530 [Mesorhizobium sp.]|uniref:hypothetical protein n=1 Tax=Mesorhizobium sp. TaxID=1871066 RepID=UPI001204A542|nr:hypothetical protein [Mesorhizobium sp.]TIS56676.1 MAG: hypothetical protein E5W91_17465 [Mesorhizobium sp.]TIS89068.1 MAG: hypothetical protein E5W89_17170 [Mesorhizobium sp.]TJW10902.1 MAG: hypothetical protein E5W82_18530 [Mesorhizobium sp.]
MGIVHWVGPVATAEEIVVLLLDTPAHPYIVSVKAAMKQAREAAPNLLVSDEELTEAIVNVATALDLSVAFDGRE